MEVYPYIKVYSIIVSAFSFSLLPFLREFEESKVKIAFEMDKLKTNYRGVFTTTHLHEHL